MVVGMEIGLATSIHLGSREGVLVLVFNLLMPGHFAQQLPQWFI